MVMTQSFPAWAEEGMVSKATGVVWLILILVKNGREKNNNKKTKKPLVQMVLVLAALGLHKIICRSVTFLM